jgi:protein-L-isoaspartate(D-aspartate) O-methyltransferase
MIDHAVARANMVENQLRPSRIDDPRLLKAMGEVPRELFVPEALAGCAYGDEDLALGGGLHLIEPLAFAKLAQTGAATAGDVVLVVGDVTGYATAVLSQLAGSVFSLVSEPVLVEPIRRRLAVTGGENAVVEAGSIDQGLPQHAPFDLVVLIGSVPEIPRTLSAQLGDGGRLVAVVEHGRSGRVTLLRKVHGAVGRVTPFDAQIHRLPGLVAAPAFSF